MHHPDPTLPAPARLPAVTAESLTPPPGTARTGLFAPESRRRGRAGLACGLCLAGLALAPAPARAWFVGGIGIGVPVVVAPPPVFYPPPYAYPPVYAMPPGYVAPGYAPPPPSYASGPLASSSGVAGESVPGMACYTGAYLCPLPSAGPPGARCSCPAESGGRAYGTIR